MTESNDLLTLYSDIQTVPVNWLWYPYIAVGKITLLQGDPGDGKSTMMRPMKKNRLLTMLRIT